MNNFKQDLDYYAENIANEICDMSIINLKSVQQTIKTRFSFIIKDLLTKNVSDVERKRNYLKDEYLNQSTPNWRKEDLKRQITKINSEIKELNIGVHNVKDYNEYQLLKQFVFDNYGEEVIKDFYDKINNKR